MQRNDIHVSYGQDYLQMTYDILAQINLASELAPEMRIGLKPNLVVAKKAADGATTSPAVIEGIIQYLQDHGFKHISIMESSWVGDNTKRAYKVCGYEEISRRYGVPLFDLKEDQFTVTRVADLDIKVCNRPKQVDYLINIPVLKAHCQTLFTCALKNLKGCIPDVEKRRFHSLGLSKPIGYLGKALQTGLTVVDAIAGDLTFEEGGNPVQMDRIIVGKDPVLVDTYAASLLGYAASDIDYIGVAARVGAGLDDLSAARIIEHNIGMKSGTSFQPSGRARRLGERVKAEAACSACYGSLIHALQRLSDQNKLSLLKQPVYIGQGFRGRNLEGIGIGQCTSQCSHHLAGCPPTAKQIVEFLNDTLGC